MTLNVDSLDIKETLYQCVNESLKEYRPEIPSGIDQNLSMLLSALLPPLVSAVATSVLVGEILSKAILQTDSRLPRKEEQPQSTG